MTSAMLHAPKTCVLSDQTSGEYNAARPASHSSGGCRIGAGNQVAEGVVDPAVGADHVGEPVAEVEWATIEVFTATPQLR